MNKLLCISAAVALALSGTALAHGTKTSKLSPSAYGNAQISASDCATLSVDSARNACMRHARAHGSAQQDMAVGGTSSEPGGSGTGQGPAAASPTGDNGKITN